MKGKNMSNKIDMDILFTTLDIVIHYSSALI